MEYQSFDRLNLYYETHGNKAGIPVVLIHGIGADHNMWKPQSASFPAAGCFTIIPDLRGHGVSDSPKTFSIADCARDIYDLLLALELPRAHLVGVSMGGMVTQQFVSLYNKHAASQILVDSLSGVVRPVERFNAWLAAILLQFFPSKLQASLMVSTYRRLGHEQIGRYFAERILAMDSHWLLEARREVNRFSIIDRLPQMHLPSLVLVGDAFGSLAIDMARTSAENIPGAEFQVLHGGGDPSNLLVPEEFDRAVLAFIQKHSTGIPDTQAAQ